LFSFFINFFYKYKAIFIFFKAKRPTFALFFFSNEISFLTLDLLFDVSYVMQNVLLL